MSQDYYSRKRYMRARGQINLIAVKLTGIKSKKNKNLFETFFKSTLHEINTWSFILTDNSTEI